MLGILTGAFSGTLVGILDVFLVILVAGLLVRRNVLTQAHITALSTATVMVFLPCLIFSNVTANLDPKAFPAWWVIPLSAVAMAGVGLVLGVMAFARELPAKRNLLPLASMQNAGYLVLPVGLALFPDRFDTFAMYCFLFILGFNPVLWSVGAFLTAGSGGNGRGWRALLTPPFAANLLALGFVYTGVSRHLPAPVVRGVGLLGQAAVPVATVVLGAVLGTVSIRLRPYLADAVRVMGIKLVLLPALTIAVLLALDVGASHPFLAQFFVIESAAAPAAGLILQVRSFGGDEQKIGSLMLASYAACTVTLPLWVAVWAVVSA
jgi:predicted permease